VEGALVDSVRSLLAAAPDAMLVVELSGEIVLANAHAAQLFGFGPDQLEGLAVEALIPEDVCAVHPGHRAHYATDPTTRPMGAGRELEGRRRDGSTFPAEISLTAIDIEGRPVVVAAIRDVSDRRRAEKQFRSLLESAPDAMVGVDASGRIVLANSQTERLFGYPSDALLGELVEVLVPESARSVHPGHRARYFAQPTTRPMGAGIELEGRRADGSTFPAEISLSSLETEQGLLVTAAIRDVTERHEAEATVRAARDEAERANRAKSEFLSRMSHELRTPLNAILGFGQLLELNDPSPRQAQHIEFILKSGRHLLELIDEVLDISRIEAGRLDLVLEPVVLAESLTEATAILGPLAERNSVILRFDPDVDRSIRVLADKQRLRQVALNLVANAIKYNRGGGMVDISWRARGEIVRVSVTDTGVGIRTEDQDRLFLPFERLGNENAVEGTGLGLALSRSLINTMGGHMGATSTFGTGSTFWFELREGLQRDGTTYADASEPRAPRARVLYVEDNLSSLRLVEAILTDRGVEVIPTLQGSLVLELARQFLPDAILLDLQLPDIDGEEVLERLKHDPETEHIPVVIVSADATPTRIQSLLSQGAFAYSTKPIDIAQFTDILDRALQAGQPSRRT
jgi:PAS domain S-box-containing protein